MIGCPAYQHFTGTQRRHGEAIDVSRICDCKRRNPIDQQIGCIHIEDWFVKSEDNLSKIGNDARRWGHFGKDGRHLVGSSQGPGVQIHNRAKKAEVFVNRNAHEIFDTEYAQRRFRSRPDYACC